MPEEEEEQKNRHLWLHVGCQNTSVLASAFAKTPELES